MPERKTDPAFAHHDAVMSWLQDREMKDRKLAEARSGIVGTVAINTAIRRMQEKAYIAFPGIDQLEIDSFVERYVKPWA